MKFFVDTADVAEIKDLAATGLLDGVTTNPSLVAKAGRDFKEIIAEICALVPGPVSAVSTPGPFVTRGPGNGRAGFTPLSVRGPAHGFSHSPVMACAPHLPSDTKFQLDAAFCIISNKRNLFRYSEFFGFQRYPC